MKESINEKERAEHPIYISCEHAASMQRSREFSPFGSAGPEHRPCWRGHKFSVYGKLKESKTLCRCYIREQSYESVFRGVESARLHRTAEKVLLLPRTVRILAWANQSRRNGCAYAAATFWHRIVNAAANPALDVESCTL